MHTLKQLVPRSIKEWFWQLNSKESAHAVELQKSTSYYHIGEKSEALTKHFEPLEKVPGWFNVDDFAHFSLVLSMQSLGGMKGDLFEIGSYHGKSTAVMTTFLGPDERMVVCDAFEQDIEDTYSQDFEAPSPEAVIANIRKVNPAIDLDRLVFHKCLSNDLKLGTDERFRFIHIDGGHTPEQAYFDLTLCFKHLMPGGIIVMDDYHNDVWPGVTVGTDRFLSENKEVRVLADLNRHGATGRKLYLRNPD